MPSLTVPLVPPAPETKEAPRAQLAVFFYLIGLGYSKEQMERMFDIADVPFSQVGDQEKEKYLASMKQAGSFQGYKLRQFWHIDNGVLDQVETYNIHRDVNRRAHPEALRPLLPEIDQFARHMNVLSPILKLMALGLELPEETLLDMHRWDGDSETYLFYMRYHPRKNNVWLKGHNDIGTITLLYSQPVSALQILARDGTWKWIKHIENAIVVNSGDAMDFLSGGLYRATIHRQPPPNQLGVIYFCMANDDVKLAPLVASPVLQGLGIKRRFERDEDAPVIAEWRKARTAAYGQSVLSKSTEEGEVEQEVIQGVVVKHNL
ncbi:Clavaminate synthase-like protein [Lentinula aff. detonsa]|uniref:Clavaminate synthase-like protein n=1 Tax=Lentinula aff. detonsa TaxID=2804958 RepID=A0AA38NCA7_9AGAR|nr:Clavaminate synthase-like protein [Lentinula aff. detonsa]